jgi:hypothetical protein
MSMKNSNDTTGNRTRNFPACNAVPQPTMLPAACPSLFVCSFLINCLVYLLLTTFICLSTSCLALYLDTSTDLYLFTSLDVFLGHAVTTFRREFCGLSYPCWRRAHPGLILPSSGGKYGRRRQSTWRLSRMSIPLMEL